MTRDDIISMAKEAGYGGSLADIHAPALERFAALVISHHVKETRPEVSDSMATWLQQIAYQHGGIGDLSRTEIEFGAMVAAAEREACAKECDDVCANFYALYKGLKALLTRWVCGWFHGGGHIKRDPAGNINWQCALCGAWADPVNERGIVNK